MSALDSSNIHSSGLKISKTSICIEKTVLLIFFSLFIACCSYTFFNLFQVYSPDLEQDVPNPFYIQSSFFIFGFLGFFIYLFAIYQKKKLGEICAIGFSFCQGVILGGLSCYTWSIFPSMLFQSLLTTTAFLICTWHIYQKGFIPNNIISKKFIEFLVFSICLFYMITFFACYFYDFELEMFYGNTKSGLAFSLLVSIIACLETIVCLDEISLYEKKGLPENYEWFLALELISGVFWIYVEIIILLFKWNIRLKA